MYTAEDFANATIAVNGNYVAFRLNHNASAPWKIHDSILATTDEAMVKNGWIPGPFHASDMPAKPFKENAKFDDLHIGDTIRHTLTTEGGMTRVTTGVVHGITENQRAFSSDGSTLAWSYSDDLAHESLVILSRPKPELPTESGTTVLVDGEPWGRGVNLWFNFTESGGYLDDDEMRTKNWTLAKVVPVEGN